MEKRVGTKCIKVRVEGKVKIIKKKQYLIIILAMFVSYIQPNDR